jgi:hypothetical protein
MLSQMTQEWIKQQEAALVLIRQKELEKLKLQGFTKKENDKNEGNGIRPKQ